MKLSEKFMLRGLLFAAPIVLGSTMAVAPSRAASLASSAANLTLQNFTWEGSSTNTFTDTATDALALDGSVDANADATATAIPAPAQTTQSSSANVTGVGRNYSGNAFGVSQTDIGFDTRCGCFRFDFQATLDSIARLTNPTPGERAEATSFVAFYIFDGKDLNNPVDRFEATLTAGNPFNIVSTPNLYFTSVPDLNKTTDSAFVSGYYERHFEAGTQLQVRGVTVNTAIATVPEPPMFAALVILPGLIWLKRRRANAISPEVVIDRRSE